MPHIFFYFFLLLSFTSFAQDRDSIIKKSNYMQDMSSLLTFKLSQSSNIEKLAVYLPDNDIKLAPNLKSISHVGLSYRFLSLGYSFAAGFVPGNNDDADKGRTKRRNFSANFNFRNWQQEFSYTKTKGYYLENTKDYRSTWLPGQPYFQFPDLSLTQYQGTTAYNFNPNFSVAAITSQAQRQLKSAGSFIPAMSYSYTINDDHSPIMPGSFTQKAGNLELLLGAGYFHNFVMDKRFYMAIGAIPHAGVLFTKLTTRSLTETTTSHQTNAIFRLDSRIGLGYNSSRFFSGIYIHMLASRFRQENTSVVNGDTRTFGNISVGYRINAPKWLSRQVQLLDDKKNDALQHLEKRTKNKSRLKS